MNALWIIAVTVSPLLASPAPADVEPVATRAADQRVRLVTALNRFDEAVSLRDHGSPLAQRLYREALAGFEALIRDGVRNGHLYYNAANAQVRLGELGGAVANYRRALRLLPGDKDVRRNLAFARGLCEVQIAPSAAGAVAESLLFWHYETSPRARTTAAVWAYVLFWLLLVLKRLARRRLPILTAAATVSGLVALAVGCSVAWDTMAATYHSQGVVTAHETPLRKGNGDGYDPQLERPLPEGIEFRIIERRPDTEANPWYHVELRDGTDGWLRADQTEVI